LSAPPVGVASHPNGVGQLERGGGLAATLADVETVLRPETVRAIGDSKQPHTRVVRSVSPASPPLQGSHRWVHAAEGGLKQRR